MKKLIELTNDFDIIAENMEEAMALSGEERKNIKEIFNKILKKLKPKRKQDYNNN